MITTPKLSGKPGQAPLTSPALIAAVLFYPSERTLPLLADYATTDRLKSWGTADLADAASDRLATEREGSSQGASLPAERETLDALLARGVLLRRGHADGRLRAALSRSRPPRRLGGPR